MVNRPKNYTIKIIKMIIMITVMKIVFMIMKTQLMMQKKKHLIQKLTVIIYYYIIVDKEKKQKKEKKLKDPSKKEERQRKKAMEKWDTILFLISTVIFVTIIFTQFNISLRNKIYTSLKQYYGFSSADNFKSINRDGIIDLFNQIIDKGVPENFWFWNQKFEYISDIRFTLRKGKVINTTVSPSQIEDYEFLKVYATDYIDPLSEFNPDIEDDTPYSNYTFNQNETFLGLGGFVYKYNKNRIFTNDTIIEVVNAWTTIHDQQKVDRNIAQMKAEFLDFFHDDTFTITVDFLLAYYETLYTCPVIITFKNSLSGLSSLEFEFYMIDKMTYGYTSSYFRAALEVIFFLLMLYYWYFLIADLIKKTNKHYRKIFKKLSVSKKIQKFRNIKIANQKQKTQYYNNINEEQKNVFFNKQNLQKSVYLMKKLKDEDKDESVREGDIKIELVDNKIINNLGSYNEVVLTKPEEEEIENQIENRLIIASKVVAKDVLGIIHIFSLFISFVCFILWSIYVALLLLNMGTIENAFNEYDYQISSKAQNDLIISARALGNYRYLVTLNFLFLFTRFIRLMSKYVQSTIIFINTISSALVDIMSFLIFFVALLMGFTIFTFFYYGNGIIIFNDFGNCLQQNLSFALGIIDYDLFHAMYNENQGITIIYFLTIILFVKFIVIKILLAIIVHFFKISLDSYNSKMKDMALNMLYSKKVIKQDIIVIGLGYFKILINILCDALCCEWRGLRKQESNVNKTVDRALTMHRVSIHVSPIKKKRTNVSLRKVGDYSNVTENKENINKEINKNAIIQLDEVESKLSIHKNKQANNSNELDNTVSTTDDKELKKVKDISLYNIEFTENYTFQLRNRYFDSERDDFKIKKYYEIKYRDIIIRALFFLLFIVVSIIMILFNTNTPWHKLIQSAIFNSLNNSKINYNPETEQLLSLNKTEYLRNFTFQCIPNMFSLTQGNNYYFMETNTLINNSILITVKRNTFNYPDFDFLDKIREYGDLNLYARSSTENMTWFSSGGYNEFYNIYESYRHVGGYTYLINLTTYFETPPPVGIQNNMIDEYVDFVVVEFILDNLELNFLTYVELIIGVDWGNYYTKNLYTHIFKYSIVQSYLDIVKLVMECFFVILLIYLLIIFLLTIKKESNAYNDWYKDNIKKLNIKTQELRSYVKPEIIRKITYIFSFAKLIEVAIIVMSFYLVYLRGMILSSESFLNTNYGIDQQYLYFRNFVYETVDNRDTYQLIGIIVLFFCSLRLIIMMNVGKFFSLLIRTVEDSKANNITFIVILLLIQPAFIFYSFLEFGEKDTNFSDLGKTIISCLNILFGDFNFVEYKSDDTVFGPIFFFLFLFVVDMILINTFFAVIYASYTKVKEEIKKTNEKWSMRRVFLFCCYRGKQYLDVEKKNEIDSEFEHGKQMLKYDSHMNINQHKAILREWCYFEMNQLKYLDDSLFSTREKLRNMEFAFQAKRGGDFTFEHNLYKEVEEKHLKCFNIMYANFILSTVEELENDIITIEKYHDHLHHFIDANKYSDKIREIKLENDDNYDKVATLESQFLKSLEDLKEIKNLLERYDELDESIRIQIEEELEVIKLNNEE